MRSSCVGAPMGGTRGWTAAALVAGSLAMAAVAVAGCGGGSGEVAVQPTAVTPVTDERGVAVRVLGVRIAADGLCPLAQPGCAARLAIEGPAGDVALGDAVTGEGWYDGVRVLLAGPLRPTTSPMVEQDLTTMCAELSNATEADGNVGLGAASQLLYGDSSAGPATSESLAMSWIDQTTHVMNYWFAHDLERYRDALEKAYAPHAVCVQGGATYSERELDEAGRAVIAVADAGGYAIQGGFSSVNRTNRIEVPFEVLDQAGRQALDALGPVIAVPFLDLLDRPLSSLPAGRALGEGDVQIVTADSRSTVGMAALGTFTLGYDATQNCVFAMRFDDRRVVLIWPYAYTARRVGEVAVVFDPRGEEVARTGSSISLAGGGGEFTAPGVVVEDARRCGATEFWIVAP